MDSDTQDGPGPTVTPLDQVLWRVLTGDAALIPFARAWLALLCRMLPGVDRAVLVLLQDGSLAPAACWPDGDPGVTTRQTAELALTERRGVVSRARTRGPSHLAFPLLFDAQDQGVIAVELTATTEAALREAMRHLQWGAAWIELHHRRTQAAVDATRLRQGYAALEVAATTLAADSFDAAARATATKMAVRLNASKSPSAG